MVLQPCIMHKIDKNKNKTITSAQSQFPLKGKKIPLKKVKVYFLSLFFPPNQI